VLPEFTNWRSEQRAWRTSCVLFDQSHHMTDLYLNGRDALRLLADFGVNTFANFTPGKAKQYVAVNGDGYFIGDAIVFHLEDELFDVVGHPTVLNWLQYQAESGGYDVTVERDDNSSDRPSGPPKIFRYELQGPTAGPIVEKLTGAPLPNVKFFNMTEFTVAGYRVRALRHGMAGQPGFELFGPWAKYIELPKARYAFFQVDEVRHGGTPVGMSLDLGHIANEHAFVSLATVDRGVGEPGTGVTVVWGEEPNSAKPAVEPHRQVEIRATVAPAPYVQEVRDAYRKS
jgi:glycine cleavage system aminomethyltransferase T